ncbi:MAG: leucine-rich repeat domain-containing protein [Lachnospiraceae bacterium]|nr:leucine-rich repeat domain-containing protein [Lachnospiraceae bacterium]
MQRKQKKLRAIGLIVGLLLGTSLFSYPTVYATEGEGSAEEPIALTNVDKSNGVTYIYGDASDTVPLGINLNGNSVIIVKSENSTTDNLLNNIYIDKNMDGKIDDGDEQVSINDSVDIKANYAIYGVYKQKTTAPIAITVNSGFVPAIFGVYEGESVVELQGEATTPAVSVTVNGGIVSSALFGAQNSTVTTDGVSASVVTINDGVVNATVAASMTSDINSTDATALAVCVNGGTVPNAVFGANGSDVVSDGAGAVSMVMNSQSETTTATFIGVSGGTVKVKNAEKVGVYAEVVKGNVANLRALYNCNCALVNSTAPAVQGVIGNGTFSDVCFVCGSTVESDEDCSTLIDVDISGGAISKFGAVVYSNVDAGKNTNTVVDVDVTGTAVFSANLYVIGGTDSWSMPEEDYTFVGNVDINFDFDALPESGNNINSGYIVTSGAVIDGNVNITLNNARYSSVYGLYNVHVKGDYVFDQKNTCDIVNYLSAGYNSKIDGNVTLDLVGAKAAASATIYGIDGKYKDEPTLVGGEVLINYNGGYANNFYGLYGRTIATDEYTKIGKSVTVNVNGGTINYSYGIVVSVNVTGAVKVTVKDTALKGSVYATYNVSTGSDVTVDITNNKNEETDSVYLYAVYQTNVAGDVSVNVDGGYYRGVNGVYGYSTKGIIGGDVEVHVKNVNKDTTSYQNGSCSYGANGCKVAGKTTVTIEDSNFYTLYGLDEVSSKGDVKVDVSNVKSYYSIYAAEVKECEGNVTSTVKNCSGNYVYGIYMYANCGGNITSTITDTTASQNIYGMSSSSSYVVDGDVNITLNGCTCSSGYVYGLSGTTVQGDTIVTIEDGEFGKENNYGGYLYGVSYANTLGETTINLTDIDIEGSVYPYQSAGSKECADVSVNITGLTMSKGSNSSVSISNSTAEGQHVTTVIDDTSVIPEDAYINPSSSFTGSGTLTYKDHLYLGGKVVFDKDVTYKNLHLNSGNYLVSQGVTVTVEDELYCEYGYILLEGTLDAAFAGTVNDDGKIPSTYVYMNGGTLTGDLDKIQNVYYPFAVEYLTKGGTVSKTNSTTLSTHTLRPGQYFVRVGDTVSYTVTVNEGYSLISATVKNEKSDAPVDAAVSGNTYSFVMEDSPTVFNVELKGNQIVLGKTVADPVIKLNQEYTDENPVYDLNSLSISNDGLSGEVTFKVDPLAALPEGLIIKDNKIYGIPTVAYEEGKKTIIHVTGKNDTVADLVLNVVVTEGNGTQTSQDGRITIDEANAMIYLNGNSIVIETKDNNTAIYLDDNKDGIADSENAAYVGDLTNYTMYGVRNSTAKDKIRITMNGGTIGTIYGAHNSTLVAEEDTLQLYMNGGSVGALYGLSDTITTGTIRMILKDGATVSWTVTKGNAGHGGYYYNNKGTAYFYGTYTLDETLEATNAYIYGNLTIDENGSLNTTNRLYRYSGSRIYLKGALAAYSMYNSYGAIMVQGGTLPEGCTWSNVYYPVETSTNLKNTSLTFSSNYITLTEDGKTTYYLNAGTTVGVTMTTAEGYDYFFNVDDGEYVEAGAGKGSFVMSRKPVKVNGEYVPKQIAVTKQFAEPEAIVNKEYTEESPLYDFKSLEITNDTTTTYGGDVKYALKSGSVLPEGLTFTGTKLIGTPTVVNETGDKVTFVVTGRNGTTADVELTIAVKAADYKKVDVNDTITLNGINIYLNGTSVVIVPDPNVSGNASIYPDLNHDKIADNNIPFILGGETSYSLSSYVIYGYTNTEKPYEGDISITMKGGYMRGIYGAYSASTTEKVVVDGDVYVSIEGGYINDYRGKVYSLYNGEANNVTLEVTGGTHRYSEFVGAYNSTVKKNVNYTFGGTVDVSASSSTNYNVFMHAAEKSTVNGDVNLTIGGTSSDCFNSYASYTYFYGAYNSTIAGNVNCQMVGDWYPGQTYLVRDSLVGKNLDIDWKAGRIPYTYCTMSSTIAGDVTVDAAEEATLSGNNMYVLYNSKAKNMYANVPKSVNGSVTISPYYSTTTNEVDAVYINNKGNLTIDGDYTFDKDMDISSIYTYSGSNVTVNEGVEIVSTSSNNSSALYGTFTNNGDVMMPYETSINSTYVNNGKLELNSTSRVYGTLDNYGDMKTTGLYIYEGAKVINRDMATWEVASRLYNSYGGRIVNYGEFNQTCSYSTSYYNRIGLVYTTKALNLYAAISAYMNTSYSTIYYPVTVDYPSQCVKSVAVSGDYVGSSGIEGDMNQYVRGGSAFTVTLGEQLMDTVTLQNITYGSADTVATEQENGTWQGTGVYEPFVVKANYIAIDDEEKVTKITLGKTADRIENTEESMPLVVGTYYSYSEPLYDLTNIEIIGDIEGEGTVSYSVDNSSTLPQGMTLKDGKLYGTLQKANEQEQVITFVVKGKNQTSAFFTLTLGAVVKNVPEWSVPTGLTAVVGETLHDVYVPYSALGTYSWPDATVPVGTEVTTLENVELKFTPRDVDNYDWETAATNAGATYANGVVTCKVSIAVSAGKPTYTIPTGLEATYGQTFGDVPIDSGDNEGTFTWDYEDGKSVGNAGTHYYRITYTPNDTANYQTVSGILVELKVNKALPTYSNDLTSVTQDCGITLADIVLPSATDGKYQWITTSTTIPINGTQYQAGYKPNDSRNYDWSTIEGWNSAWGCVVFPVTVYVNHTYSEEWVYDDDYHWHACLDETCESQGDKEEHEWVEGEVIEESTLTTEGSRKYNCSCGAEKTVVTPVLPHDTHTYSDTWSYNDNCHWKECTFEGCNKTTMPVVHTLDDGTIVVEATDRNPGVKKYACECGYYETEEIPQLPHTVHTYGDVWEHDETTHWQKCTFEGCAYESTPVAHTWDTETIMTPATETSTGVMKYTCVCGEEKIETIPELEHTAHVYKATWSYDEDEHWHECENADCDEVSGTEKHTYGNPEIIVAATEDNEGTRKYTCVTCGYSYNEQYDLAEDETQEPLEEDEEFEDEENQITYMVTSANSEVQFVSCENTKKTDVTIPDTVQYGGVTYKVTAIADEAFKNHPTLKSIKMGANIKTIGKKAFYGCKKLTSVTIGKNVTVIGESAFQNCTSLKKITIPAGVITIGKKAFYGCKKLSTVKMGKNVQTIGNSAFQNCIALKKIEIPSKVKKIGSKAFYGCKKLTSITIKTTKLNTSKVGKQAFTKAGSSNYKKLTVKVPKKKKKAYKTMLKKRGLSPKAKIK